MDRLEKVGGRYLRGQIFVSIIVGILCGLVLFLLKVDFPVLLGFIAGITNLIPFIGPFIGAVPAALAALFISPLKALLVVLLFIAVQQLDSYVISPNVMKYQVGVHPASCHDCPDCCRSSIRADRIAYCRTVDSDDPVSFKVLFA